MYDARAHPAGVERADQIIKAGNLGSGEGSVFGARAVGDAEVRVEPLEVDRRRRTQQIDDLIDLFRGDTHAAHPGVDLHVHAVASSELLRHVDGGLGALERPDRERQRGGERVGDRLGGDLGEQQDWRGNSRAAQLDALVDNGDRERVGPAVEGRLRRERSAVTVPVRFHNGAQRRLADDGFERGDVVGYRGGRDLRPGRSVHSLSRQSRRPRPRSPRRRPSPDRRCG